MLKHVRIWPKQEETLRLLRERTSESIALQSASLLESNDYSGLNKVLKDTLRRQSDILSIAIVNRKGERLLQAGDHYRHWQSTGASKSTLDNVRVDIDANGAPWGELQVSFKSSAPGSLSDWLQQPIVLSLTLLILGGVVLYAFYLRRVFSYLDPSSTIPDRVSVAFDAFSEGVMMVDRHCRIVLINQILRGWIQENNTQLFGKSANDLHWLKASMRVDSSDLPWLKAMESQAPFKGWHVEFMPPVGNPIKAIVNCMPIMDAGNYVRGCLITFDNVTELERINMELISTMAELVKSREEIEKQNDALKKLATRDPMTSCLNRRAFFEEADRVFAQYLASGRPLSCIMTDIDHFKQFNDRFGHAVGDKVIVSVSRALFSGLRVEDLLCRYGGEEFCILLPDASPEVAKNIADRLREEIESQAGPSIRSTQTLSITSSFGVATLSDKLSDLATLIDRADQALYVAKRGGRNCVRIWEDAILIDAEAATTS